MERWDLRAAGGQPLSPIVMTVLSKLGAQVLDLKLNEIDMPALILDVGLIHVHRADMYGNAQIDGVNGFAIEMARASKTLIIGAEQIVDCEVFRSHPHRTTIPYFLVDTVVHAPFGSHPGEMCYLYHPDEPLIRDWVKASESPETTQAYLDQYIYGVRDHQEYLELIGRERLDGLRHGGSHEQSGG